MEDEEIEKLKKFVEELKERRESLRTELNKSVETLRQLDEAMKGIANELKRGVKITAMNTSPKMENGAKSAIEVSHELLSTGIRKLDDLLFGGLRLSRNVLLYGPPFSGKDVLSYNFIAKSLEESVPVVVISTDRDINQIKYEVGRITDLSDDAEESGMLKFVDAYSKNIQIAAPSEYATVVDSGNISSLIKTMDGITSEIRKEHQYYRLLFSSLTPYISQDYENKSMRFLQQFVQKRRAENAVSFYILEEGLFESNTYDSLSYMMDGAIEFKTTNSGNRLRVKGLGNARTRDWVEMYQTDTGFDLGSFTLERIK